MTRVSQPQVAAMATITGVERGAIRRLARVTAMTTITTRLSRRAAAAGRSPEAPITTRHVAKTGNRPDPVKPSGWVETGRISEIESKDEFSRSLSRSDGCLVGRLDYDTFKGDQVGIVG
jgi:hypothetical protein